MENGKKVILISKGNQDLDKNIYLRDSIHKKLSVPVWIICGEKNEYQLNDHSIIYIYKNFTDYKNKNICNDKSWFVDKFKSVNRFAPSALYKSDVRFIWNAIDEKIIALEQIYLIESAIDIFEKIKNKDQTFLFMAGAAILIRTAVFHVGKTMGLQCYRIMGIDHLVPKRMEKRYWFCNNDYCRLDAKGFTFHHDKNSLEKYANLFLDSISKREHVTDKYTRDVARHYRVSSGIGGTTKDVFSYIKNHIFGNDLKRQNAKRRLSSFVNYKLNKHLSSKSFESKNALIFAINVPDDAQIQLRAPQYSNILSISSIIARMLPVGVTLALKEHPGHPGMIPYSQLKQFLKLNRNVIYLDATYKLNEILPTSLGIVTINSSSVLDAYTSNIPVITLGNSFYSNYKGFMYIDNLFDLNNIMMYLNGFSTATYKDHSLRDTLCSLYAQSFPIIQSEQSQSYSDYRDIIIDGITHVISST